jgi:hypothetical protein
MSIQKKTSVQSYVGLSTDTKKTKVVGVGAKHYDSNTGLDWEWNGFAWLPITKWWNTVVNYKQISLAQSAAAYDVMTATTQACFIDAVIVHVPDDLSAVASFTAISVATDDDSPIEILSATDGAKAKLTGNFYHVYTASSKVSAATKKIQLTIGGATAGTGSEADITVFWRPVVAGGYYLNA